MHSTCILCSALAGRKRQPSRLELQQCTWTCGDSRQTPLHAEHASAEDWRVPSLRGCTQRRSVNKTSHRLLRDILDAAAPKLLSLYTVERTTQHAELLQRTGAASTSALGSCSKAWPRSNAARAPAPPFGSVKWAFNAAFWRHRLGNREAQSCGELRRTRKPSPSGGPAGRGKTLAKRPSS